MERRITALRGNNNNWTYGKIAHCIKCKTRTEVTGKKALRVLATEKAVYITTAKPCLKCGASNAVAFHEVLP